MITLLIYSGGRFECCTMIHVMMSCECIVCLSHPLTPKTWFGEIISSLSLLLKIHYNFCDCMVAILNDNDVE